MKRLITHLPAAILAVLLAGCIAAAYLTQDTPRPEIKPAVQANEVLTVDEGLAHTARRLFSIADSSEEQALAREAVRLADLELDRAYAGALRDSAFKGPALKGPLKQLAEQITALKSQNSALEARIAVLSKTAASDEDTADQLVVANAQFNLGRGELEDAEQDLARQGGDPQAPVERAFQERQAARHQPLPTASSELPVSTMSQQLFAWFALRGRQRQLDSAYRESESKDAALDNEHDRLEKLLGKNPSALDGAVASKSGANGQDPAAVVARLQRLSDQRSSLAEIDKRIQDTAQLSTIYQRWRAVVAVRKSGVAHLLLVSLSIVLAILLTLVLIAFGIRNALGRQTDRRRLHQLRLLSTILVQVTGAIVILLVIFGVPTQTSTMIGLATAGLTVALKDFVVAFFGWFALMGKNGIRVGDWVEIEGVGGEVIEIGVLKTILLEMGNWSSTGHPTGRRVAFVNKFAIENHYFNFTTAGQWLWDELQLSLPPGGDAYATALQIRDIVDRETTADAGEAQQDWERVTNKYGTRQFSAKPAVDLKPSPTGLDVVVHYITRAPQRSDVKSRLLQAIVAVIHKGPFTPQPGAP